MAGEVLWFSVEGSATITADGVTSLISEYTDPAGRIINAARIAINENKYVNLYYQENGVWVTEEGLNEVLVRDFNDAWEGASWQPADISGGGGGATVTMELGYIDLKDAASEFYTMAFHTASLSDLQSSGYTSQGGTYFQAQTAWAPSEFYRYEPAPEPTSASLLLLGVSALLMRRRRRC